MPDRQEDVRRKELKDIMGWNGSGGGSAPVEPKVTYPPSEASFAKQSGYRGAKKPSPIRGLIAGGLVCVLAVGAYFAFFSGDEKPQDENADKGRGRIKEVAPARVSSTNGSTVARPEANKTAKPAATNAAAVATADASANKPKPKPKYHDPYGMIKKAIYDEVFENECDRDIAAFLVIEPGTSLLGDESTYYEGYDEIFLESIKEPIIVKSDDTEEVKNLKRAVIEVKADLKARLDKGESVEAILRETRKEFRELGLFKEELQGQVDELCAKENLTAEDVDDCVKAANLMLEGRGCAPFRDDSFFRERLMMRVRNQRKENSENAVEE